MNRYLLNAAPFIHSVYLLVSRDPKIYPDFDEFRPERFLDVTEKFDEPPADAHGMGHATFGFGRRCGKA
jgi:cytochrome P450